MPTRLLALLLAALVVLAAAGVILLGGGNRGPRGAGASSGSSSRGEDPAARAGPAALTSGASIATRREQTTVEGDPAIAEALAQALLPKVAAAGQIDDALAKARSGAIDANDLGLKLHDAIMSDPASAARLVPELTGEKDPALALKIAQALAGAQDDAAVRAQTIDALAKASPEARAVGLLALLGRGEAEALSLEARSFQEDPAAARATAGFLLNQAPGGVPEGMRAGVLDAARQGAAGGDERVREESLGLLGRSDMSEADQAILERALLEGPSVSVRSRALRALVESGVPFARVRPVLERALAVPGMPDELQQAIRVVLATR